MAAGVPIIGILPDQCEIACIITEHHCGIVTLPHSPDDLIAAITDLYQNNSHRTQLGINGKAAINSTYSLDKAASAYFNLVNSVI